MTDKPSSAQISTTIGQFRMLTGGPQDAQRYVDQLVDLYESDFYNPPIRENYLDIFPPENFRKKILENWSKGINFKIITVWGGDGLAGFICGAFLPSEAYYWKSVREPLREGFDEEDGRRTLLVTSLVIRTKLRGHGLASQLHKRFLEGSNAERVTLLSEHIYGSAYLIWQHWGYQKIGTAQPAPNETIRDVFILQLK